MNKNSEIFQQLLSQGQNRTLSGAHAKIVSAIAVAMVIFQVSSTFLFIVQPLFHRSVHLSFILILALLCYTPVKNATSINRPMLLDWLLAGVVLISGLYYISQIERIVHRWPLAHPLEPMDIFVAIVFTLMVLEITRRVMGPVLFGLAVLFLLYTLFGHNLPGILSHRHFLYTDVLDHLVFTDNGIFASPLAVASTFVFLFVLFGVFFAESGAGDFFYRFAIAIAGRSPGGAGKVAIVCSALFGTINGSPVANTVTTGSFTIPMMKRTGYDPVFSGAVEAVASTGGSVLPPIMGTAAFLMVEMAGVPYRVIVLAALLPAMLYYIALYLMVHFRALKTGLKPVEPEDIPELWPTLKEGAYYFLPLVVLIYMLFSGYTPSLTAVGGLLAVIVVSWFRKDTRMTLSKILVAMEKGARAAIPISMACAAAGMVINGLMITGLGGKVAGLILSIGGESVLVALMVTAILCIILGMGMPVPAAYALTASLAVPSLYELGVAVIPAHLFVVYFAVLSAITPPVAVAAYAASGISGGNPARIGFTASKLGIVSFLVPFMFVYDPRLLLQTGQIDLLTPVVVITALIGVYALSSSLEGWMISRIGVLERFLLLASGLMLMYPAYLVDAVGIIFVLLIFAKKKFQQKKALAGEV